MKYLIILLCNVMLSVTNAEAQTGDILEINKTIHSCAKAADQSNVEKLDMLLDDNYVIVMNRLFGSSEVSVMTKETYLGKIRTKEFGADNRKVEIQGVMVNLNSASAKVVFIGEKMTFTSIILLIKNAEGQWKLVNETPMVT